MFSDNRRVGLQGMLVITSYFSGSADHTLRKRLANPHEIIGSLTTKLLVSKICVFVIITINT
jgi:hypothetical protein